LLAHFKFQLIFDFNLTSARLFSRTVPFAAVPFWLFFVHIHIILANFALPLVAGLL